MQSLQGRLFALLSAWLVNGLVSLLVLANVINLDADLSAMGASAALIGGGPSG